MMLHSNKRASYPLLILFFVVGLTAFSSNSFAQTPLCPAEVPEADVDLFAELDKLNFGVAIGLSRLSQPDVTGATAESIVEGNNTTQLIARIDSQEQFRRELWLESHYLIFNGCLGIGRPYGHGPFAAVSLIGGERALNAFALGYLVAFKQNDDPQNNDAFNVGLGVNFSTLRILGDGIVENQQLPPGVQDVRRKQIDDIGLMLMISFTFLSP